MADRLTVSGLTRRFGGLTAVDRLDLRMAPGELVGLIGPNGAGKTTLFNLLSGQTHPDAGSILLDGKPVAGLAPERLRWVFQQEPSSPRLNPTLSTPRGGEGEKG